MKYMMLRLASDGGDLSRIVIGASCLRAGHDVDFQKGTVTKIVQPRPHAAEMERVPPIMRARSIIPASPEPTVGSDRVAWTSKPLPLSAMVTSIFRSSRRMYTCASDASECFRILLTHSCT